MTLRVSAVLGLAASLALACSAGALAAAPSPMLPAQTLLDSALAAPAAAP